MSNNPPYKSVYLSKEEYDFLMENCDTNIVFALNAMQNLDMGRSSLVKMVELLEKFKAIKSRLEKAE